MDQDALVDKDFPLFSKPTNRFKPTATTSTTTTAQNVEANTPHIEKSTKLDHDTTTTTTTFANLGLAEWAVQTCKELGMHKPTPVQTHCIPKILAGRDVLGLAQTGSGKTAAFALPILHRLAEDPFGIFGLVVTPTRELAYQLAEQFRALGSCLHLRCTVVVGGMDMLNQAKTLMTRPHLVIATPGRIKVLLEDNPDIPPLFSNTRFLVLDEADRVLDVGFEEELRVVFKCLPKNRQTLLFSATMTSELEALLELSANKAYFYEAYEGFKTVATLKQQYIFIPNNVKDVYLMHILSKMEDMGVRSAIIFVSTCRSCHLLSLLLEELDQEVAALHSFKSQSLRLAALHRFKSGQVTVLLATDVASRGLDIPTVDLVVNYDIPRYTRDYTHRVGRTARAGRGGLAVSFVTEGVAVVNWCYMCKKSGESVNHLLLHCRIAYELWSMVWALFGLQWVMPHGVFGLFSSWQGSFGGHQSIDLWRAVPHCVLWCIWRERNSRCFEGKERSISELKSLLLHTLLEWSSSFNLFSCSKF